MIETNPMKSAMQRQNEYILHFHFLANGKSQNIKDMLYRNEKIRVASINPKNLVYAITTYHKEMWLIFESLKSLMETGEAMAYECKDDNMLCDCFVKPRKVVTIYIN
ncbi:hypothetical protein [Fibrobacter sp. UWB10]|uniref:hypothetical protein n=1 Tax=Fibrobacter sp. UWB10 TaxID=1896201 RepID=UPI00240381A0|nr:hypothetical protein [Fibrobacter sp. UWB10]SMP51478.1 hypothetical protein SAMN05720465_1911 [Fibrobacter sp. UWB10]